jgi:hypothetical protein
MHYKITNFKLLNYKQDGICFTGVNCLVTETHTAYFRFVFGNVLKASKRDSNKLLRTRDKGQIEMCPFRL